MDLATIDHLLTTTRSVRKRLDLTRPVEPEVIEKCLEIALQAPTGTNAQAWHFIVLTDPDKKRVIARRYRAALDAYFNTLEPAEKRFGAGDPRVAQQEPIYSSANYLADHLHEVPVHIIAAIEGRLDDPNPLLQASAYGSVLPAVWSLMLALRARGLGSAWTTLHLAAEAEIAKLLGIPANFTQAALLPVAYYTGKDFKPAKRLPLASVVSWNAWGAKRGG